MATIGENNQAIVGSANYYKTSDNGEWTCSMGGVVGSFRIVRAGRTPYNVIVFNDQEGTDSVNIVVGVGDRHARIGTTIYLKTKAIDGAGLLCDGGEKPFAFEFDRIGAADNFETWYTGVTGIRTNSFFYPALQHEFVNAVYGQQDFKFRNRPAPVVVVIDDGSENLQHASFDALDDLAIVKRCDLITGRAADV
jgi:hypothetical protein